MAASATLMLDQEVCFEDQDMIYRIERLHSSSIQKKKKKKHQKKKKKKYRHQQLKNPSSRV